MASAQEGVHCSDNTSRIPGEARIERELIGVPVRTTHPAYLSTAPRGNGRVGRLVESVISSYVRRNKQTMSICKGST